MPLNSMTGFARSSGANERLDWHWEVRSVNGRGLDVRLRLPPGHERIEPHAREAIQKRFRRGNVSATLTVRRTQSSQGVRINTRVLDDLIASAEEIRARLHGPPIRAELILALKGVVEADDTEPADEAAVDDETALLAGLDAALADLQRARGEEGGRLAAVLAGHVDEIERLVAEVASHPALATEAMRERLTAQLARLVDASSTLDTARLHQEAALLATRADVTEELKRLTAHIAAVRELIRSGDAAGRRLDFLAQEFNREANTLCSKSADSEITSLGLDLKATIDQLREQVQNIE